MVSRAKNSPREKIKGLGDLTVDFCRMVTSHCLGITVWLVKFTIISLRQVAPILMRALSIFATVCCCCCLFLLQRPSIISEDEKGRYYRLKARVSEPFNPDDERHRVMLASLYRRSFLESDSTVNSDDVQICSKWVDLGFQSQEPAKDFRGGGVVALNQMCSFFDHNHAEFLDMVGRTKHGRFIFACNSIRVTTFLRRYFFLEDDQLSTASLRSKARYYRMKNLCNFLSESFSGSVIVKSELSNETSYHLLHHGILVKVSEHWKYLIRTRPELTILQMSIAEKSIFNQFARLFEQRIFKNLNEFLTELKKMPVDFSPTDEESQLRKSIHICIN